MNSCLLCLQVPNETKDGIIVNSLEWLELEIQNIIEKHFWSMETMEISTWLCHTCWEQLQDFHKFYKSIESAHLEFGELMRIEQLQEPELKEEVLIEETNLYLEEQHFIEAPTNLPKFEWDDGTPLIRTSKRIRQATKKVEEMKETTKVIKRVASGKVKSLQEQDSKKCPIEYDDFECLEISDKSKEISDDFDSNTNDEKDEDVKEDDDDSRTHFNNDAIANKTFTRKRQPNQDMDVFISKHFKLTCVLCDSPMETYHALCDHFESEHQQRGYAVCCKKRFIRRYLLYEHLQQHLDPNYLKCYYCSKTFTNRQILKSHTKKQHLNSENKSEKNPENAAEENSTKKEISKKPQIKPKLKMLEEKNDSNDKDMSNSENKSEKNPKNSAEENSTKKEISEQPQIKPKPKMLEEKNESNDKDMANSEEKETKPDEQILKMPDTLADNDRFIYNDNSSTDNDNSDTDFNNDSNFNITFSNSRPSNKFMDKFISENIKLTCDLCNCPMETYHELCEHFQYEHQQRGYAVCCKKRFIRRYLLYEHLQQHLDPNYLSCNYCSKTFANRQILKAHIKKHYANDVEYAKANNFNEDLKNNRKNSRTSSRNKARNQAMDVFIDEHFNITCLLCDIPMENFQTLSEHFDSEHQEPAYLMCCDKKFFKRYLLCEHINQHLDPNFLKCDICERTFTSRQILKAHSKTHDANREKNHCCDVCGLFFSTPHVLKTHKTSHLSEEEKLFPCETCGKKFGNNWTLKSHIRSIHGQSSTCDFCGLICVNKSVLKKHIDLKHSSAEPQVHTCPICSKTSINRKALERHIKYFHHMDYKHKCTHCERTFKLPLALKQHVATHTGIPLYSCAWCPRKFNKSSNISSHRRKWHPKEWEEVLRKKYSGNLPPNYEKATLDGEDAQ